MTPMTTKRWTTLAVAAMSIALAAASASAYPTYSSCVSCHTGFDGGPSAPLHAQHLNEFGITTCNACHSNGPGTTVYTFGSGAGGGYGCAGCHGQAYGEIAINTPYAGQPKASGWGLRQVHQTAGVTTCQGCHGTNPGPVLDETVAPPYYLTAVTSLTNPCFSGQEDLATNPDPAGGDADALGLDNDGNGQRDYPADLACAPTTTTTTTTSTTTTTLPVSCGPSPAMGCTAAAKAKLIIGEKAPGKEKLKFQLTGLVPVVAKADFGNPVTGNTSYALCVYDGSGVLTGSYEVARAGEFCEDITACWSNFKTLGYAYADGLLAADGVSKMQLSGGEAGKGKVKLQAKNSKSTMPTGVAALLNGETSATAQLLSNDGDCFGMALPTVKKADGLSFSAAAP